MFLYKLILFKVQRDAFGFCSSLRQFPCQANDSFAIFLLAECGDKSLLLDAFHKRVWQVAFGAVAYFDASTALL